MSVSDRGPGAIFCWKFSESIIARGRFVGLFLRGVVRQVPGTGTAIVGELAGWPLPLKKVSSHSSKHGQLGLPRFRQINGWQRRRNRNCFREAFAQRGITPRDAVCVAPPPPRGHRPQSVYFRMASRTLAGAHTPVSSLKDTLVRHPTFFVTVRRRATMSSCLGFRSRLKVF